MIDSKGIEIKKEMTYFVSILLEAGMSMDGIDAVWQLVVQDTLHPDFTGKRTFTGMASKFLYHLIKEEGAYKQPEWYGKGMHQEGDMWLVWVNTTGQLTTCRFYNKEIAEGMFNAN